MEVPTLLTDRLIMRPWREDDRSPFAALNADPVVMEHFPGLLSRAESDAFVDRAVACWARSGWGLWAVELAGSEPGAGTFIGYVGLWPADVLQPGAVEVGWRLARSAWGHGYAPEAARDALRFGFGEVGLGEIVSFTVVSNANSRRVMEKIGLRRQPERDFEHPRIDPTVNPELVRHVVYAIGADQWRAVRH